MQDFQRGVLAAKKIATNYLKYFSWTKNVRLSARRKTVAAALVIGTTALIFIYFPVGEDNTSVPEKQEPPQYNYDIFLVLQRFGILAKEKNIVVCIIEPHILFSMLSPEKQNLLTLRTSFNFSARNRNVVTVAVQGKSGWKLSQNAIKTAFESASFSHVSVKNSPRRSFSNSQIKTDVPTHHFYIRHRVVIHAVVFYQKSHYFWHSKLADLPMEVAEELQTKNLFFADSDSIYDSFHVVTMDTNGSYQGLYVPDNIEHFLSEIPTSHVIECRSGMSETVQFSINMSVGLMAPPDVFLRTADSVIAEMKSLMYPRLAPFWLASGTLLGWYRDCGIIPYTSDLDFATWSSDLNEVLEKDFKENSQIKLLSSLGQSSEDLEFWLLYKWLRVDLFFTYQNDDHFWVGGHNPSGSYSFRYIFPKFDLCSGDFLGHKVLVPCQVERVLEAEYGSGWMTPVASWNYEASARNVMGRRYWNKDETFNFIKQISVSR